MASSRTAPAAASSSPAAGAIALPIRQRDVPDKVKRGETLSLEPYLHLPSDNSVKIPAGYDILLLVDGDLTSGTVYGIDKPQIPVDTRYALLVKCKTTLSSARLPPYLTGKVTDCCAPTFCVSEKADTTWASGNRAACDTCVTARRPCFIPVSEKRFVILPLDKKYRKPEEVAFTEVAYWVMGSMV